MATSTLEGVNPRVLIGLVLAAVLALAAVVIAAERTAEPVAGGRAGTAFAGSLLPPGVRAPDFELRNQDGDSIRMRDLRGRPVIVSFLYTNCEETCPPQAQQVKGALDDLGRDVPALAVAVDPPRDTPRSAARFLDKVGMRGRMDFVLGSRRELAPLWRGYAVQPQSTGAEHQARIVLVDARGFQRVAFPLDKATPEGIAHDVAALDAEG